ncbi:acetyl xylan esterase [Coprinopsis cinerea AmutBmut pab1-1]|nr:acetyl xylan esterase [Coprinopsis cinerea AmutBmut pab1-1]
MSSGIQGLGPYRYWQLSGQGENLENSKQGAPWWTCNVISGFLNNHQRLPYDAHMIAAAIAPRYMVIDEGQGDPFVNARGTATIVYPAAREVYKWLGIEDRIGMAIRGGGHCDMSGHTNVVPFLQKVFFNATINRDYNNLAPWSATTTAYPWATNLPQNTAPPVTPPPITTQPTPSTTPPVVVPTPPPSGNCASKFAQCGGNGWTGPTCCVSGSTCNKLNDWYSQCV